MNWDNEFDFGEEPEREETLVDDPDYVPPKKTKKSEGKVKIPARFMVNLLDPLNMATFTNVLTRFRPTNVFDRIEISTVTLTAALGNVSFHERELIKVIEPTYDIPHVSSNWGEKTFAGWEPPKRERKSNRGRPPRVKAEKPRKKQGSGKCFSSQMQMAVRTEHSQKGVFKIKVFRTGTLQIPGATVTSISDVIRATHVIAAMLDTCESAKVDKEKPITLTVMNRTMTNYKTCMLIEPNEFVFLDRAATAFAAWNTRPTEFLSSNVKAISNKFIIEVAQAESTKRFKVNIFQSGKINFQGAYDDEMVFETLDYLTDFVNDCRDQIIFVKPPKIATPRRKKQSDANEEVEEEDVAE